MADRNDIAVTKIINLTKKDIPKKLLRQEINRILYQLRQAQHEETKRQMDCLKMKVEEFELVKRLIRK